MSDFLKDIAFGVIGGTGVYQLTALTDVQTYSLQTPYGIPSDAIRVGFLAGKKIAFLARHGEGHGIPPHKINYRANLAALAQLGVTKILALNTVGGITPMMKPQALACPDQIIDYTWGRISTLCEEEGTPVLHVDFGHPYTPAWRDSILKAAALAHSSVVEGGCYGATQGPRLETNAEIHRMQRDGCDLVGMTGMPEASLARELNLEYACLCIVANWAAGCGDLAEITMADVLENVRVASAELPKILTQLVNL